MLGYDYDLIVIGAGAAGLTASTGAGQLGAKTLLIEREKELGGDCLHFGCVPSKSLIKSAYCCNIIRNSSEYGLPEFDVPKIDLPKINARIKGIVNKILEHDSPEYIKKKYNVETKFGMPKFVDKNTIQLNGEQITSKFFVIATGSSAVVPKIEGIEDIHYLTNRDIFSLEELPRDLIVLGGGPIGVEMSQAFARLGSNVKLIQSAAQLLPKEDADIAEYVKTKVKSEGVEVLLSTRAVKVAMIDGCTNVFVKTKDSEENIVVKGDALLVSVGRKPNIEELSLREIGVEYALSGIKVDARLRTTVKNIFACGDVVGGYQFTHVAGYEAGIVMMNAIMRLPVKTDYTNVPWVTYFDPEIASVGMNEKVAKSKDIDFTIHKEEFKGNDRALAEGESDGFIKILRSKKNKVLGVQIVGFHAGDLIHEWVAVLNGKVSISTLAQSIHAYPTLSEISKIASGNILAPMLFNKKVKFVLRMLFGLKG